VTAAQRTRKEDKGVHGINGAVHLLVLVLRPVLINCGGATTEREGSAELGAWGGGGMGPGAVRVVVGGAMLTTGSGSSNENAL